MLVLKRACIFIIWILNCVAGSRVSRTDPDVGQVHNRRVVQHADFRQVAGQEPRRSSHMAVSGQSQPQRLRFHQVPHVVHQVSILSKTRYFIRRYVHRKFF